MRDRGWMLAVCMGLSSSIVACGDATGPDTVRKTIGPAGGLISSHDHVLSIVLLPGALTGDVEIQISPSDEPPPIFGLTYRVRPDIDLRVDAEVSYRRVLPSNPNAATVAAIRREDYVEEMGHWEPLPRLYLDPERQAVIAADDRLSLYYGLLEDADAPPLPPGDEGDPLPPTDGDGTTTGSTDATGSSDDGTTAAVDPTTSGPGPGPTTTTGVMTTVGTGSSDDGMGSSDGVEPPMFVCSDGMPQAGELCLMLGATYASGLGPIDLVVGNFDADPAIDAITLDGDTLELGLLAGNGDGTLQASVTAAAPGGTPVAIERGDFDGDGLLDVVVLDTGTDAVSLWVGDGAGGFGAPLTTVAGAGVVDLAPGDFNGDPALDLSVLAATDQTLQLLLGGPGGMALAGLAPIDAGVDISVANADYSGDGVDDTMALGAVGFHAWATDGTGNGFIGDASGPFGAVADFVALAAADIDGDGNNDVAALDLDGDQLVYGLSTGGPATFVFQAPVPVGTDPSDLLIADLDGDGRGEVVICSAGSNDVTVLDWNGAALVQAFTFPVGMAPRAVAVAQLDGDGVPDVLVAAQVGDGVTVLLSDP